MVLPWLWCVALVHAAPAEELSASAPLARVTVSGPVVWSQPIPLAASWDPERCAAWGTRLRLWSSKHGSDSDAIEVVVRLPDAREVTLWLDAGELEIWERVVVPALGSSVAVLPGVGGLPLPEAPVGWARASPGRWGAHGIDLSHPPRLMLWDQKQRRDTLRTPSADGVVFVAASSPPPSLAIPLERATCPDRLEALGALARSGPPESLTRLAAAEQACLSESPPRQTAEGLWTAPEPYGPAAVHGSVPPSRVVVDTEVDVTMTIAGETVAIPAGARGGLFVVAGDHQVRLHHERWGTLEGLLEVTEETLLEVSSADFLTANLFLQRRQARRGAAVGGITVGALVVLGGAAGYAALLQSDAAAEARAAAAAESDIAQAADLAQFAKDAADRSTWLWAGAALAAAGATGIGLTIAWPASRRARELSTRLEDPRTGPLPPLARSRPQSPQSDAAR